MLALDKEVKWILGRPNFMCRDTAMILRSMGHDIKTRSEDEQAAAIHWMLCLYEEHGDTWHEKANDILKTGAQAMLEVAKKKEADKKEAEQ